MNDFKINRKIRCDKENVNKYIVELESYILGLKASNTLTLIFMLDKLNGVLADDIQKMIDGNIDDGLKILTDDKDNKAFDRVMTLYSKMKDIKEIVSAVKSMIPDIQDDDNKSNIDKTSNIFDQIQQQYYIKNKNKK